MSSVEIQKIFKVHPSMLSLKIELFSNLKIFQPNYQFHFNETSKEN